jgi:hypothetical protein
MKTSIDTAATKNIGSAPAATRRRLERKIVGQFRAWIHDSATLETLYGPNLSYLEKTNRMRGILGVEPLTRADIPPGEDWETPEPRRIIGSKERRARQREILSIPPDDEEPVTPPASEPPEPPSQSNQTIRGVEPHLP